MDRLRNPPSPGAGTPPPALVGHDRHRKEMDIALHHLLACLPANSMMLPGLQGVGKAVLLMRFVQQVMAPGYVHEPVERQDEHVSDR